MIFNSFSFIFVFCPIVIGLALKLKGQALLVWISLASFVFYALFGQPWFIIPMLITTLLDYSLAPLIADKARPHLRKIAFAFSLCGNLGLLFYFKYANFFLHSFLPLTSTDLSILNVLLPAGISFYTFQTLSYVIDVYKGELEPEMNLWKFVGFVSFFPHLVAGPLTRHHQLLPALENIKQNGIKPLWQAGIYLFVLGLSKKLLIADPIAAAINPWLLDADTLNFSRAWLALIGYSFQIYFDFSGYSDMAIGLGRLFGIELPQNFADPYQARNPSDFWRRWHITLSNWLRDYLYIPLGGNQKAPLRNILITMFLGGLWHGASWTFVAWGLYHGTLLVLYHTTKKTWETIPAPLQQGLTFVLIMLGWVFFRSDSFSFAYQWFGHLSGCKGVQLTATLYPWMSTLFIACFFIVFYKKIPRASSYERFNNVTAWQQVALGILFSINIFLLYKPSPFLYFRF